MILLLDTSTPECRLGLVDGDDVSWSTWQAHRELANGLLGYIVQILGEKNQKVTDISGIGVFKGPGSFTGLRIGITVANTIADSLHIPIVGASGDTWSRIATDKLHSGDDDKIVLPDYGSEAHITKPRK